MPFPIVADDYGAVMERAKKTGVERVIITAGQATETEEALELIANTGRTSRPCSASSDAVMHPMRLTPVGCSRPPSYHALANAPQLYTTVGCHPTRCKQFEAGGNPEAYLAKLLALAKEHPQEVVAIGECGLDYDRLHFCPKETQLKYGRPCRFDERSAHQALTRTYMFPPPRPPRYFEWQFQLAEQTGLPMFLHDRNTGDDFYRAPERPTDPSAQPCAPRSRLRRAPDGVLSV